MERVFYTAYNRPKPIPEVNEEDSLTWQHCKDECDIMKIVKKPSLGINPLQPPTRSYTFDDYSGSNDFHEAQNIIANAKGQFEELPANIRDKFDNDPFKMLQFVENPENLKACQDLGLVSQISESTPKDSFTLLEPEKAGGDADSASVAESSAQATT